MRAARATLLDQSISSYWPLAAAEVLARRAGTRMTVQRNVPTDTWVIPRAARATLRDQSISSCHGLISRKLFVGQVHR